MLFAVCVTGGGACAAAQDIQDIIGSTAGVNQPTKLFVLSKSVIGGPRYALLTH